MPRDWITQKNARRSPGRGQGSDGRADAGTGGGAGRGSSGGAELDGAKVVKRRHADWAENQMRWRFLLDSLEGGNRYRNAVYGNDRRGLPCRNLFRHRREYPDAQAFPNNDYLGFPNVLATADSTAGLVPGAVGPWPGQLGADPGAVALDDDYELRRARTPVPGFVAQAQGMHLAKIYHQEVSREAPPDITEWWKDVDGKGTTVDDWMKESIGPLLTVLGKLDVVLDHPAPPPGVRIRSRADEIEWGLDKVVASYIMPENMLWWRLDAAGRYLECLVREYVDPADRVDFDENGHAIDPDGDSKPSDDWRRAYVRYRLWSGSESILFSYDGETILERTPHRYGRVPIVLLTALRNHRTPAVGKSYYEEVAEFMREYYNRDSELILSDTLQAHPFLSGAEDFCKADNTLSVGPGYVLPMKKNPESGQYQGWEYVSPPKDPAESLRRNKADLIDAKDTAAHMTKPAGTAGTSGATVGQSGVSKQIDSQEGHEYLTGMAKALAKAERAIAEFAAIVLRLGPLKPAEREQIKVVYPSRFSLYSAAELTDTITKLQLVVGAAGQCPEVEAMAIRAIVRQMLPGLTDLEYRALDDEIDRVLAAKASIATRQMEMLDAGISDDSQATGGVGSAEADAGSDPTGQSGATGVSGSTTTGNAD